MADRRSPPIRDGVDGIADEAKAESRRNAKPTGTRRTKEKRAEDAARTALAQSRQRRAEILEDATKRQDEAKKKNEAKFAEAKKKNEAQKESEQMRRRVMAPQEATASMGKSRIAAMAKNEGAEKLRDKMAKYMAETEKWVHSQITLAIQESKDEKDLRVAALEAYSAEIQDLYYQSANVASKGLKDEFIPMLEEVADSVTKDTRLKPEDRLALKASVRAAIDHIKKRQTRWGQATAKVSSLISNDVVVAALAGAATKSPLIALGVFAWKNHKKSGTSKRELDQKKLEQKIAHAKGRATGAGSGAEGSGTGPAAPPAGAGTPTGTPASPGTPATPAGSTGGTTATPTTGPTSESSPLTSGGAGVDVGIGSHLLEVVRDHTRLLTGIFSNTTEIVKLMERMRDQAASDAEEKDAETPDTATRTSGGATGTAVNAGEEGGGGGFISNLLNRTVIGKGFGIVSKFFKGGGARLAKTAATATAAAAGVGASALGSASRVAGAGVGAAARGAAAGATAAKGAGTLIRGALMKRLPGAIAKMGGKSIPLLGAAIGIGGGIWAALKGDWAGAGLEAVSGLGSALTAIPLTIASLARSVYMDVYGIDPLKDPDVSGRMSEVTNAVQAAVMEKIKGQQPTPAQPEKIAIPKPAPLPVSSSASMPNVGGIGGLGAGPKKKSATRVPKNALSAKQLQHMELIKASLAKRGITDPKFVTSIMANILKESQGQVISENLNYSKNDNPYIREIFASGTAGKTDAELNVIKKDPKAMAEMQYGKNSVRGKEMGSTEPGDGWKYRGRGFIQLTGKKNYTNASHDLYGDDRLVKNPDLVLTPQVAADVSAWHMDQGKARIAKKLGIDTANMTQAESDRLATSMVAGSAIGINRKNEYLQSLVSKVNTFSANLGDVSQAGRAAVRQGMIPKTGQPGMGQPVTVVTQGGNTNIMGGGGNSRGAMPIPAPVDREPTMRRMLG